MVSKFQRYLCATGMSMWQHDAVTRVSRAEAKERTRQRLLTQAQRLFRERGYAATSLEQIADAADVTKGAIYGHFTSKEDLLLSAIEQIPTPDSVTALNDQSTPLRDRLARFGRAAAVAEPGDDAELAMMLEFFAALLRAPQARQRYGNRIERRLHDLAEADQDRPTTDITPLQVWTIGDALLIGLQLYRRLAPDLVTPEVFERAFGLLAAPYEDR